jgi:hypothetical protein
MADGGGSSSQPPGQMADGGGSSSQPPGQMANSFEVFTADPSTKIQPTTALGMPPANLAVTLAGPRGAVEAYQLVIRPKNGQLTGIAVIASDLSDGSGHTIPAAGVTFYREVFVDFTGVKAMGGRTPAPASSPTKDGRVPDPLVPLVDPYSNAALPFSADNANQPVWIDVAIPSTAAAGKYSGTITVQAGSDSATVPLDVEVWDLTLPDMRTVTTWFRINANPIIDFHKGTASCGSGNTNCYLDDNAKARLVVKRYEELAHAHRIDGGQAFIPFARNGCSPVTDWSAYDAALAPYMDGSYFADHVPSSRVQMPFSPGDTGSLEMCSQAEYTALAQSWAAHLKSKSWFGPAIAYALDEPPESLYPAIAQASQWMQAGDPDWLKHIMDTTAPKASSAATLDPAIGIYVACLKCYADWYFKGADAFYGRNEWPGEFNNGKQLWFYESIAQGPPYSTFATNTLDGGEPRIMMWGSWFEGATGFLYYMITGWDLKDPWGPTAGEGKTGDGMLVYPGNHDGTLAPLGSPVDVAIDGPVPSYRLKMVRSGLQDWALFALAQQHGLGQMVRQSMATVYNQLGGCGWSGCSPSGASFYWKTDDAMLSSIRTGVAQALMAAGVH